MGRRWRYLTRLIPNRPVSLLPSLPVFYHPGRQLIIYGAFKPYSFPDAFEASLAIRPHGHQAAISPLDPEASYIPRTPSQVVRPPGVIRRVKSNPTRSSKEIGLLELRYDGMSLNGAGSLDSLFQYEDRIIGSGIVYGVFTKSFNEFFEKGYGLRRYFNANRMEIKKQGS